MAIFNSKLLVYQNVKPLKHVKTSNFIPFWGSQTWPTPFPFPTMTHIPKLPVEFSVAHLVDSAKALPRCWMSFVIVGWIWCQRRLGLWEKTPIYIHLWRASGKWKISETENWQTYGVNPFFIFFLPLIWRLERLKCSNGPGSDSDSHLLAQNSDADQLEGYTPKHPETQAGHAVFCSRGSQVCRMSMQVIKGHRLH